MFGAGYSLTKLVCRVNRKTRNCNFLHLRVCTPLTALIPGDSVSLPRAAMSPDTETNDFV